MTLCFLAAGNSVHSHRWIRFFARKGHEIHWISLTPNSFDPLPNVTFHDLSGGGKWLSLLSATTRIRSLLGKIKPDVVHAHYIGSYGFLGALSGFQPLVLTAWGSDVLGVGLLRGAVVRWILRKARAVTCDGEHMKTALAELGVDQRKIELVRFGVELDQFSPGPSDNAALAQWGASSRPVVISLRNLEPVYDLETVLSAASIVTKRVPEVLFLIFGSGSRDAALKQFANELALNAHVTFAGPYVHDQLPRILRSSQVYVSTALSDGGIAASTAEAMACGVPVVITDTGENRAWIENGKSGFIIPPKAIDQLAARIVELLRDGALRERVGKAGRDVITARNDYVREMEKMDVLYRRVLGGA